jgi:hypothetical protein
VGVVLSTICAGLPVLVLHGHEHPKHSELPEFEPTAVLGDTICARSKVISCARQKRGVGALIEWDAGTFAWTEIYRPSRPRTR